MNMQEIYGLIDRMAQSNLGYLKIEHDGTLLEMSHGCTATAVASPAVASAISSPIAVDVPPAPATDAIATTAVCAPLAGTFYAAAAADSAPFVQVGDSVKQGQALCILEAMKTMNELPSPIAGTVAEILVQNGDVVGYDTALFRITPC